MPRTLTHSAYQGLYGYESLCGASSEPLCVAVPEELVDCRRCLDALQAYRGYYQPQQLQHQESVDQPQSALQALAKKIRGGGK